MEKKKETELVQSQSLCAETKRCINHNDKYYIENQKRKVSNTDTGKILL